MKTLNKFVILLSFILLPAGCSKRQASTGSLGSTTVDTATYGELPDGREVKIFTLTNANGMIAKITEYGAILVSLEVPDRDGKVSDVTHGYGDLEGWLTNTSYFGSTVGRYGNRVANGKFTLDGKEYTLATNNAPGDMPCHPHGGEVGFDKVLWTGETFDTADASGVTLTYESKDGEEGYPGTLTAVVTYSLNNDNELVWEAKATVEGSATPVNIVHHSYWNLSNDRMSSINDHLLTLPADYYLPTDAGLIPTGEMASVEGTPFEYLETRRDLHPHHGPQIQLVALARLRIRLRLRV